MKDLSLFHTLSAAEQSALLEGPAMTPPPGVIPNLTNPPNQNDLGYGVTITVAVISGLLVLLRVYVRAFYHKKLEIEDGVAIAALGAFAGHLHCVWKIVEFPGAFVHLWDVKLKYMTHILYYLNSGSIIYGIVIMLLKSAILLQWARTFVPKGFRNTFWWICHILLAINVLFYVACTLVEIFGCTPRRKLWTPGLPGTCVDMTKVNIASAIVNFSSDLIILYLPQRIIWSLHMSTSKKLGVATLFAVGVFACVCAGFRIHSSFKFASSDDIIYNLSDMGMWSIGEMISGFCVLCLPATPKLFANSPWIRQIGRIFQVMRGGKDTASSEQLPQFFSPPKRRMEHASLFVDSDKSSFASLTSVSIRSEISMQTECSKGNGSTAQNSIRIPERCALA